MSVQARFKQLLKRYTKMNNLDQNSWREKLNADSNAVILDVRTASECAQGVIPNARMASLLDGASFIQMVKGLDKSKTYYVYCRSGARSAHACSFMEQEGFTCYNLNGGIMSWTGDLVAPITN